MKTGWKTLLAGLAAAGLGWAAPASAQSFGFNFGAGPQGGISFSYDSGGYCDQWGCPDDFWDMPLYYGPVYFGGYWYDGPVYYRDWYGRREFWIHGGWHVDEWRGPRPAWYRPGRVGPALGLNFYRNDNRFHGRWDNDRRDFGRQNFGRPNNGRDFGRNRPNFAPRDDRRDFGRNDNRPNFAPRDDRQGFNRNDNRGGRTNAAPPANPAPPAGTHDNGPRGNNRDRGRDDSHDNGPRNDRGRDHH